MDLKFHISKCIHLIHMQRAAGFCGLSKSWSGTSVVATIPETVSNGTDGHKPDLPCTVIAFFNAFLFIPPSLKHQKQFTFSCLGQQLPVLTLNYSNSLYSFPYGEKKMNFSLA